MLLGLTEIASLSKSYSELSGRTDPVIADVIMGFVEMGKLYVFLYSLICFPTILDYRF